MISSILLKKSISYFTLFIILTILILGRALTTLDIALIETIQILVPTFADTALSTLSVLGNFEISIIVLFLLLYKSKLNLFLGFSILGISQVIELFLKRFLYHPGPPGEYFRYNFPFVLPSTHIQPGYSYPSGHSLRMVFLAMLAFYVLSKLKIQDKHKKYIYTAIICFSVLMLISRVSLGEHWPSDVVGGSLLGAGSVYLLIYLMQYTEKRWSQKKK
jgi:membrane-associated phospholipid phosphatase